MLQRSAAAIGLDGVRVHGHHGGHVHHRQRRRRHHGQPALTGVFGFAFLGGGDSASRRQPERWSVKSTIVDRGGLGEG